MAGAGVHREIEIKLRLASAPQGRRLLAGAGFRLERRRALERNVVYDTTDQLLRGAGRLLRLRRYAGECLLTYKGPPEPGRHKRREELEVPVAEPETFERILGRLGLKPSFFYEKYRTVFRRARSAGIAALDETPIGTFLELEGPGAWIDRTARRLGFRESDYITASYGYLFLEHCCQQGRISNQMRFSR